MQGMTFRDSRHAADRSTVRGVTLWFSAAVLTLAAGVLLLLGIAVTLGTTIHLSPLLTKILASLVIGLGATIVAVGSGMAFTHTRAPQTTLPPGAEPADPTVSTTRENARAAPIRTRSVASPS